MVKDTDDDIISEAKTRFKLASDWESQTRENFRYDRRFDAQDSVNMYGWPEELYRPRLDESKPCLTVNRVHQHVLHVANDALKNKPSVTVRAVGNGATFKAAEILSGVIRHIEVNSRATDAYDCATMSMTVGGIGWWRVVTDYESDTSFSQELKIKRVPDPLSIYADIDIKEADGSDMNWAFAFSSMPKDIFDKQYPKFKDSIANSPLGEEAHDDYDWLADSNSKHVRVVEYYRRVEKKDTLHMLPTGATVRESDAKDVDMLDELKAPREQSIQSRDVFGHEVEWYLIGGGDQILDRNVWPGSTIPLVKITGEETVIDGILDRRGLVRSLTDSQTHVQRDELCRRRSGRVAEQGSVAGERGGR